MRRTLTGFAAQRSLFHLAVAHAEVEQDLAQLDQAGKLGALFGPKTRPDYADSIESEEGWILGVQP